MFAAAAPAQANTQYYLATVPVDKLAPGQTKGLPVYVDFDLVGKRCPLGRKCFRHAIVRNFSSVDWAFPNCPDVEDQVFYHEAGVRAKRARPHHFHVSGGVENDDAYHLEFDGRFPRHGRIAKGWFMVTDTVSGCNSGHIFFTAHRDTRVS
jgi:hypothetical protein